MSSRKFRRANRVPTGQLIKAQKDLEKMIQERRKEAVEDPTDTARFRENNGSDRETK